MVKEGKKGRGLRKEGRKGVNTGRTPRKERRKEGKKERRKEGSLKRKGVKKGK